MKSKSMEGNVSISHQALEQVFTDSVGAGNVEVGGLLVGYLVDGGVHIIRAIPTSRGTFTRIPITSEDMARAAEKLSPSEQLVGWYHSHPGHTVFFSQEDIESHETFLQYNPFFKALVIDPYQAKNGDPVADCVKFYTVRNRRAIPIDDYRITDSSGQDYYDPREFVFDRNGFAHYRPLARVGITEADDRELRQRLGAVMAEREDLITGINRLEKEKQDLNKILSSNFKFPRRVFPLLLIILILIPFMLGLAIGEKPSQERNEMELIIDISENNPDLDWDNQILRIDARIENFDDKSMEIISAWILLEEKEVLEFKKNEISSPDGLGNISLTKRGLTMEQMKGLEGKQFKIRIEIKIRLEESFTVEVVSNDVGEENQERGEIQEETETKIILESASFFWEDGRMEISADLGEVMVIYEELEIKEENISIYLWPNKEKSRDPRLIDTYVNKDIDCSSNMCTITVVWKEDSIGYGRNLLGTHKYLSVKFNTPDNREIESNAVSVRSEYSVRIEENPIISNGVLTFHIVLHGPVEKSLPRFDVYLQGQKELPDDWLFHYDGQDVEIKSGAIKKAREVALEGNKITVILEIKANQIEFFRGRSLYVSVHIWGGRDSNIIEISIQ